MGGCSGRGSERSRRIARSGTLLTELGMMANTSIGVPPMNTTAITMDRPRSGGPGDPENLAEGSAPDDLSAGQIDGS